MKCNVTFVAGGVLRRNAPEGCSGGMPGREAPERNPEGSARIAGHCRLVNGLWDTLRFSDDSWVGFLRDS